MPCDGPLADKALHHLIDDQTHSVIGDSLSVIPFVDHHPVDPMAAKFVWLGVVHEEANEVLPAVLRTGGQPFFRLSEVIIERKQLPLALYNDRHGVFWHLHHSRMIERKKAQFGRAMQDLGVVQVLD